MNTEQVRGVALALLMVLSVFAFVPAPAAAAGPTDVSVVPSSSGVASGNTVTFSIVLENADNGVGTYDFNVTVSDASNARITAITPQLGPDPSASATFNTTTIASDGSTARVQQVGVQSQDTGQVTLATVTIEGVSSGEVDVSLTGENVYADENNDEYTPTLNGATLVVDPTPVTIQPTSSSVGVGSTTTYDIVLEGADGGVGTYDVNFTVDDTSIGTITDVQPRLGPDPSASATFNTTTIAPDGSTARIQQVGVQSQDTGDVVLATVTVQGEAEGQTTLSLTGENVYADENNDEYTVATEPATLDAGPQGPTGTVDVDEESGSLDPSVVQENSRVDHQLTFEVGNVSADGNPDTVSVTLPNTSSFVSVNSLSVTDAQGNDVQVTDSPTLSDANGGTDNRVSFDVSPDRSGVDDIDVTVSADATVDHGEIGGADLIGDVDASIDDSDNGFDVGSVTRLTIEFVPTANTFVSAEVRDTTGTPITTANTGLQVEMRNTDTNRLVRNSTGGVRFELNQRGETRRVQVAANDSYRAEIVVADEDLARQAGLDQVTTASRVATPSSGETIELDVTVERRRVADDINVRPGEDSAFVGGTNTFTVTVVDRNGDPISGVSVIATVDDSRVGFVSPTSRQTDSNGETTFTVTADEVVTDAELTFRVAGTAITTTALKSFVQSGEGSIQGTVINDATTDPVEDASVWAVLESQYQQNQRYTQVGVSGDNDGVIFVRLVDNSSGAIIDNDEYDVRATEGPSPLSATGTGVRLIEQLNVTNASVGEGFAVVDTDNDGQVNFSHTRLEPEEYYAEVSFTGNLTSDDRIDGDRYEDFSVREPGPAVDDVFSPPANLTLTATAERADQNGDGTAETNTVDSPGFVNSFGEDTEGTNAFGQFKLTKLFTEFQEGRQYVVIATASGFSADFADAVIIEDGDTFELRLQRGFNLEPEDVEPANIEVEQFARHPPLSETGGSADPARIEPFASFSSNLTNPVPRDRSIDLVELTTTTEFGDPVNGSVIFEVEDDDTLAGDVDNFEGDFVGVLNSSDDAILRQLGEDTVVVSTGQDGQATLLVEADAKTETREFRKTGTLRNDLSESDSANVTLVGVVEFQSASISGIATGTGNTRVSQAAVYVTEFTFGSTVAPRTQASRVEITPLDNDNSGTLNAGDVDENTDQFRVALQEYNRSAGVYEDQTTVTLNASELATYGFPDTDFPSIQTDIQAFNLYIRGSAANPGPVGGTELRDGEYTLTPVPAVDEQISRTNYEVRGFKLSRPQVEGNAEVAQGLIPGFTGTANVVFPQFFQAAQLSVSAIDTGPVATGESATIAAQIRNTGQVATTQSVTLRFDANQDGVFERGEQIGQATATVLPSENETAEFDVIIPNVDPGQYQVQVLTEDSSRTATIDVVEPGAVPGGLDPDGDGTDATDPNGDGLFEDVNGDGQVTVVDVSTLLNNRQNVGSDNTAFDFNEDGQFSIADVSALLNAVTG